MQIVVCVSHVVENLELVRGGVVSCQNAPRWGPSVPCVHYLLLLGGLSLEDTSGLMPMDGLKGVVHSVLRM